MEIYLAAAENIEMSRVLHWMQYPYRLCSYYNIGTKKPEEMLEHSLDGSKWIMDSGLFSFMFGASKGELTTYQDFYDYAMRYVDTMHEWGWQHTIVECDCQRLLGVEETYRLREDVFDKSGFEVMYVWHAPDGIDALETDQYRKRERIALSVPEIRSLIGGTTTGGLKAKRVLLKLLKHAYGHGPKVHLLGNTESALLDLEADSSDSSSWIYCVSFGKGTIFRNGKVTQISVHSPKWQSWVDWACSMYPEMWERLAEYGDRYRWLVASAKSYQMMTNQTHGDHPWELSQAAAE